MYIYIEIVWGLTMLTIYGLTSDVPFVDGYTSPSLVEALRKIPRFDASVGFIARRSGLNPSFTAIARWISMNEETIPWIEDIHVHPFLVGWYGGKTYSYIFLQPFGIWGCFHHWTFSAFGRPGFSTRTLWPKAVALGPVMHLRPGWNMKRC